ncbi:MAG TPA: hypothetical protein VI669_16185, partial [Vicinamibacteria bacterium]
MPSAHSERRALLQDAAIVLLLTATLVSWFAAWPRFVPPAVPAGLLVATLAFRFGRAASWPRRPRAETVACLVLATLYRLPALKDPWGFVNKDGAYGAFVALHIQQGQRPAPVFTEGANYQGTLKGHLGALIGRVCGV